MYKIKFNRMKYLSTFELLVLFSLIQGQPLQKIYSKLLDRFTLFQALDMKPKD